VIHKKLVNRHEAVLSLATHRYNVAGKDTDTKKGVSLLSWQADTFRYVLNGRVRGSWGQVSLWSTLPGVAYA